MQAHLALLFLFRRADYVTISLADKDLGTVPEPFVVESGCCYEAIPALHQLS
jgi:hypothetical protein